MESDSRYRAPLLAACFLLFIFTLFFFPVLFEGSTFFFRDIHHFAYPMKLYIARIWAMGEWPYWYPYLFQGTPFMSLMHPGVFYPPSALFLLQDFLFAFHTYFLFHHLVLMVSVYALCRYWERSIPAALCASLTALLGGYFLSLASLYNQFQSAIWLPLILLLWQKFMLEGGLKYFCGAVVFLAFQVLGGGPEHAIFSVLLIYAHSLYLVKDRGFKQKTLAVLALGLSALALSAVQWVPTYHFLQELTRGGGLNYASSTRYSLMPGAVLDLFLPENFTRFLEQVREQLDYMDYFVHSFYMGIVPLFVLFGCLLVGREQKAIRFWLTVFGIGVFFALGKFNPLYSLFHEWVPLFGLFRYPQKFFFFSAYAMVFLSAWGIDRFVTAVTERAAMKKLLLALLATVLIVAGMFWAHTNRAGLESLMILLLLALAIFALHLKKINGFFCLLLLLMVMDLMGKNAMLIPLIDREFYTDPPPLAKRLGGTADSFRVYNGMLVEKMVKKKLSSIPTPGRSKRPSSSYNILDIQLATRDQVYPNLGAIYDLAYVEGSATMKMKSSLVWYESFLSSDIPTKKRILQRSNVKYWVTEDYEQLPSTEYPRGLKKVNVFEAVLPRAFLVGESRTVPKEEHLDIYYDSAFDPLKQVLLTEPVEMKTAENFSGQVEQIEYGPNRVTVKTRQNEEGFLVLLDTWFPGWKVEVDGQAEKIYQANYFYRGVKLGPGSHQIKFSYEPVGLRMGATISGATFVLLLLAATRRQRDIPSRHEG
jgi:hypothetical protein